MHSTVLRDMKESRPKEICSLGSNSVESNRAYKTYISKPYNKVGITKAIKLTDIRGEQKKRIQAG